MNFWVIYEKTGTGYGAWCPDLLGCISSGKTLEEALVNMKEAITGHLSVMRDFGEPVPVPTTISACMHISEEELAGAATREAA